MDPKVIQLWVDAFDAVKNTGGRRQNVQIYGLTPLMTPLTLTPLTPLMLGTPF